MKSCCWQFVLLLLVLLEDGNPFQHVLLKPSRMARRLLMVKPGKQVRPQGLPRAKELDNPNRLKITGGSIKGLKIDSPEVYLRPMMAKVGFSSLFICLFVLISD
jgi:hypothetical protein